MAVYVDKLSKYHSGEWCHMWADSIDELHNVAAILHLKRAWFQDKKLKHYDLRASKRRLAIKYGVIEVGKTELHRAMQKQRLISM